MNGWGSYILKTASSVIHIIMFFSLLARSNLMVGLLYLVASTSCISVLELGQVPSKDIIITPGHYHGGEVPFLPMKVAL